MSRILSFLIAVLLVLPALAGSDDDAVVPGAQYMLRNVATGSYLMKDGTTTKNEAEASNWRVVTNDTIRYSDAEKTYIVYSDDAVMQLTNSGGGWKVAFTGKGNTTYVMPSTTTEKGFKFRYRFALDTRYLNVEVDAEGNEKLTAARTASSYNDWEFVPTTHPKAYRYRLMSMNRSGNNTKYTLAYLSHDVTGEEVWLSGWTAVPWTASSSGGSGSRTSCPAHGSTRSREHPYCAPDIMAEESVDLLLTVHDLLRDMHAMDCSTGAYPTYGIGYSQGGAIILACQRYVENSPKLNEEQRKAIHWVRTCAGAGPYCSLATISQYYFQDKLSMPVAAPLLVMGMVAAYPDIFGDIRAEEYFSEAFNAAGIVDKVRSTDYTIDELNEAIQKACGNTMQGMLSEDAKDTNSDLSQHLLKALGRSDLTRDWSPKADIWFFHNTDDDVVPYLNTMAAYKRLKDRCQGQCALYTTGVGMSHLTAAIDFMARMILGNYK